MGSSARCRAAALAVLSAMALLTPGAASAQAPDLSLSCDRIALSRPITFHPTTDTLDEGGTAVVQELAALLAANPWIERLRIEVHSDGQGSASYNLRQTDKRAQMIAEALVAFGVAPERLVARGLGETEPIDTNATVEGRAHNRRVELIIEAGDCPGAVEAPP
jgi:outer membrane protein OmpA-like peptidoglycan-associated protein